jgi:hypothetical protein
LSGKNDLELVVQLRGQRLVVRQHQRRPADRLDHLGHGERLARPGDAQQHLMLLAVAYASRQLRDGVFLISARPIVDRQSKAHLFSLADCRRIRPRDNLLPWNALAAESVRDVPGVGARHQLAGRRGDVPACTPRDRRVFAHAEIAVAARPSVAGLYARENCIDRVILYPQGERTQLVKQLRAEPFDCAILLQNAFDAALVAWRAGIPERIGYKRDGRGVLLTRAIDVPEPGEIPRHERYYYLELLRRVGMIERFPSAARSG